MHRTLFVKAGVVCLFVLASVSMHAQLTPTTEDNAALDVRCGAADIRGSYGFVRTGVNAQGAIAAVGVGQFDGDGNMTTTQTTSRNGVVTQGSFPGTYEVLADCRGVWYDASNAVIAHFVLLDGGNEFFFLSTSPGNTITGHGKRIAPGGR